jgi:LCP family protein required for cell wall assembly
LATAKAKRVGKLSIKKILLTLLLVLTTGSVAYAYTQYRHLRDSIITKHEGYSTSLLSYVPGTKLDAGLFSHAGDGRVNIVMVGIGGDNHPGSQLTDSIQVLSIDTINKKMALTSIPRDLMVPVTGYGRMKMNAVYETGETKKVGGGGPLLKETVSSVLGVSISNYVLIDFEGAKSLVDTLGGITVTVPQAIYDGEYPADTGDGFKPFSISAGVHDMNGDTALRYARSRHSTSDFDRSKRQQIILEAIKQKALSLGVLANPIKVNSLITVLGKHLKTDLQTNDITAILSLYKELTTSGNNTLSTDPQQGLLTDGSDSVLGYICYPVLGYDMFSDIHRWFQKNNPDPLLAQEKPTITLFNGGGATAAQLKKVSATLTDYGYTVSLGTGTPRKVTTTQVFGGANDAKAISRNYLSAYFGLGIQTGNYGGSSTDFEVFYVPSTKK